MNPEIPSFKKNQEEEKEKKSVFQRLFQGKSDENGPLLRVRGESGGTSLMDRLKQFKKKDLAFILSGLGVLTFAPIAEHLFMGPSDEGKVIRPGFDSKGNFFNDAGAGYEPGTGSLAPGGLVGQSGDIVTPLNMRDPSSLILGPGGTQQPSVGTTGTSTSGTSGASANSNGSKQSTWGDVVKDAARNAGNNLREASPAVPHGALNGSIRGLSALAGMSYGGGPSGGFAPISAANVPNRPTENHGLNQVLPTAGYRGLGPRGISQSIGSPESLQKAADQAAGLFNKTGSAAGNLDQAANQGIPGGGSSSGGGGGPNGGGSGSGGGDKGGGNANKDTKSMGESLSFLMQKQNMEKALDLQWKEKEYQQFDYPKEIQEGITQAFLQNILGTGVFQPFGQAIQGVINKLTGGVGGGVVCISAAPDSKAALVPNTPTQVWKCDDSTTAQAYDAKSPSTSLGNQFQRSCPGGCYKQGGSAGGGGGGNGNSNGNNPNTPSVVPTPDTITGQIQQMSQVAGSISSDGRTCQSALKELNGILGGCSTDKKHNTLCDSASSLRGKGTMDKLQQGLDGLGLASAGVSQLLGAEASIKDARRSFSQGIGLVGRSSGGKKSTATGYLNQINTDGAAGQKDLLSKDVPLEGDALQSINQNDFQGNYPQAQGGSCASPKAAGDAYMCLISGYTGVQSGSPTNPSAFKIQDPAASPDADPSSGDSPGPLYKARKNILNGGQALANADQQLYGSNDGSDAGGSDAAGGFDGGRGAVKDLETAASDLDAASKAIADVPKDAAASFQTMGQCISDGATQVQNLQANYLQPIKDNLKAAKDARSKVVPAFNGVVDDVGPEGQNTALDVVGFLAGSSGNINDSKSRYQQFSQIAQAYHADPTGTAKNDYKNLVGQLQPILDKYQSGMKESAGAISTADEAVRQIDPKTAVPGSDGSGNSDPSQDAPNAN